MIQRSLAQNTFALQDMYIIKHNWYCMYHNEKFWRACNLCTIIYEKLWRARKLDQLTESNNNNFKTVKFQIVIYLWIEMMYLPSYSGISPLSHSISGVPSSYSCRPSMSSRWRAETTATNRKTATRVDFNISFASSLPNLLWSSCSALLKSTTDASLRAEHK